MEQKSNLKKPGRPVRPGHNQLFQHDPEQVEARETSIISKPALIWLLHTPRLSRQHNRETP
jgi:hypothetical protein